MKYTYPTVLKIEKYGLTVKGWSRGSQNTGFAIPELKILFDTQISAGFNPTFIFVTHGHTDHCFSLPMRLINAPKSPNVFVPIEIKSLISDLINATIRLGNYYPKYEHNFNIIGANPHDIIQLNNNYKIHVYDLCHNVPCRGYGLQLTRTKLKEQYVGLPSGEIVKLKKNKVNITETHDEKVFAYLTDTTHEVFDKNSELLEYPYVMIECTFLPCRISEQNKKDEMELAAESHHMHWNNLYPIMKLHKEITFVLIHFSNRYTDEELTQFSKNIPEQNIIFAI